MTYVVIALVALAIAVGCLAVAEFFVTSLRVKKWASANGYTIIRKSYWLEWIDGSHTGFIAFGRRNMSSSARIYVLAKNKSGDEWILTVNSGSIFSAIRNIPVKLIDQTPANK